jgi:hypothetical protein
VRSEKKFKARILIEVTIQARDSANADRRWEIALRALDISRYPGMKITQQIEPYWIEETSEDVNLRPED